MRPETAMLVRRRDLGGGGGGFARISYFGMRIVCFVRSIGVSENKTPQYQPRIVDT